MLRNLTFALLFAAVVSCNRSQYPATYTDATGTYTRITGNEYHKKGDRLTAKGYRVYKMRFEKGEQTTPQVVSK
jgi:hypothetical protein